MRFLSSPYIKPVGFLILSVLLYVECVVNHNKDLDVFIGASRLVFNGKNCYEVWLHSGDSGLKYFYSPLFAILLFPIKDLPQAAYNFIWLSFNLLVAFRIFKLLPYFLNVKLLPIKQQQLFYFLTAVLSARFLFDCFSLGQMTFILVWGSLESMRLIHKKRIVSGSAILALIINIKLIPVALLAYLVYKKNFAAFALTLLFFVLYLFLPALFIGYHFNIELLGNWYSSITTTNTDSITADYGRQSLSSFIPALLMDTPLQFEIKRNLLNLDKQQVGLILNCSRFALIIALVWLFGKPFDKITSAKNLFYDLSLLCLITPLFFPHQGKYSFFYLLPANAYCLYMLIRVKRIERKKQYLRMYNWLMVLVVISFALLTLTTDGIVGRQLSNLFEYLQVITLGTFFLLFALITVKPKKEKS